MYDLSRFNVDDLLKCSTALRKLGADGKSMEEGVNRIVRYFHETFVDERTGENTFALIRFYKTHPYSELSPDLRGFVQAVLKKKPDNPHMKCLTLLATAGDKAEWNNRRLSVQHQVIPLVNEETVHQAPMIAQLVHQFGLEVSALFHPDPSILISEKKRSFNLFYVPKALGSPHIPAQEEFVIPHKIESVIGFGGLLPSGQFFALILFSKVPITREVADLFPSLAITVKGAILPFEGSDVFDRKR